MEVRCNFHFRFFPKEEVPIMIIGGVKKKIVRRAICKRCRSKLLEEVAQKAKK